MKLVSMTRVIRSLVFATLIVGLGGAAACKGNAPAAPTAPAAAPVIAVAPGAALPGKVTVPGAELIPIVPPQVVPNGVQVTGTVRALEGVAGAIQGNGTDVTPTTALGIGNIVQVLWNGTYYQGQIVGLNPDATARIHYVGWANSWDENVPRARLKQGDIVAVAGAVAPAHISQPPPPAAAAAAAPAGAAPGTAITATTVLAVGQAIVVEWNGRWYPSTVVAVNANGTVRIHYAGWADSWDEDAARTRIHLP